jgi:inosine-uridine nucleoside N-ribohydrolase
MEKALQDPSDCETSADQTAAWDWMYEQIIASPEPVTLCLLGPATNLAMLLHKYPDAAQRIEQVLFAGGCYSFGTVTASACHKVYFDAEGMQFLMHAGVPFCMATVDATSDYEGGTEVAAFMEKLGGVWGEVAAKAAPAVPATRVLRAPLAMVSLTHGDLFGWDNYKCNVELHGALTYGMTVIYRNNFDGVVELESGEKVRVEVVEKDKNIWDMREFDRKKVLSIVEERLSAKNGGAA